MSTCIVIRNPVIKRGELGSSYQEGRVGIQLSRGESWDPVIKRGELGSSYYEGELGSSYQEGRIGIPLSGLTLPHLCTCPKPGSGFPTLYAIVFIVFNEFRGVMVFNATFNNITVIS
jgi:hypothetical protein